MTPRCKKTWFVVRTSKNAAGTDGNSGVRLCSKERASAHWSLEHMKNEKNLSRLCTHKKRISAICGLEEM